MMKNGMTDLELDVWEEWIRQKQRRAESKMATISDDKSSHSYFQGRVDGMIDAMTMLSIVSEGKRYRPMLDSFREKLVATGDYNEDGSYHEQGNGDSKTKYEKAREQLTDALFTLCDGNQETYNKAYTGEAFPDDICKAIFDIKSMLFDKIGW